MTKRRTAKQARRFCMASPDQLSLNTPRPEVSQPITTVEILDHACPSCEIGAHEHCTGDGCDCCGTKSA